MAAACRTSAFAEVGQDLKATVGLVTTARACTAGVIVLSLVMGVSCGRAEHAQQPETGAPRVVTPAAPITPPVVPAGGFAPVAQLVDAAIAAPRMPGAERVR